MRIALALALALWTLVGLTTADAATPPRSETIVFEGNVADWALVLANPANSSRDGQGSSGACATSTDRDCPINSPVHDLLRFAWTWDATNFYFYTERAADRGRTELVWIYIDADGNGLLESGSTVIQIDADTGAVSLLDYFAANAGGDPLEDAGGFADGHVMAGSAIWRPVILASGQSWDRVRLEAGVPWTDLGLAPGAAFNYHVSSGDGVCAAANVIDNMGGWDGGAGTTAWRALSLTPDTRDAAAAAETTVRLAHVLENQGNIVSVPLLSVTTSCRTVVELWRDDDGDGVGDVRLCRDAEGDGRLGGATDVLDVAGDSDGDGRLDAGPIAPGGSVTLVAEVLATAGCASLRLDLAATDSSDASTMASATDVVRVGSITLEPDRSILAVAGAEARCAHVLRNNTAAQVTVDLAVISSFAWPWQLYLDVDANGNPAGDPLVTDTDADGVLDVTVSAGGSMALLAAAPIPAGTPVGFVELMVVRASQDGSVVATASDRVTVRRSVELGPNYLGVEGREHRGPSGGSVYFAHRLVNALTTAEAFDLTAASPEGWPVAFLTDPDRDGRPFDAVPMTSVTPTLPGNGGVLDFLVRVDLPGGAVPTDSTIVTVTASSPSTASATDAAYDEAVAAIVTTWEDLGHAASLTETTPCSTVHVLATGVPASTSGLRFEWRDAAGATRRVRDVDSDPQGRAEDSHALGAGEVGDDMSVEIQLADGTPLDVATFDVEDSLSIESLATGRATYNVATTLEASLEVVNASFLLEPRDVQVRWLVLSQDRSAYLDASGAFLPWSGTEWTSSVAIPVVAREQRLPLIVALPAAFPGEGTHVLEAWLEPLCGPARLAAAMTFAVVADADDDGLRDPAELAAGTSPTDADSDDDGLADGADGLADSDSDGRIDALDCDSDDDQLPDGLESGVVAPLSDTDVSAGCFATDTDPSSTTDPDLADTDGGGLPDGAEDRDRDGSRDAGDKDARDAADDAAGCMLVPPAEITTLRVSRSGAGVTLAWNGTADACVGYDVLASESLPAWRSLSVLDWTPSFQDDTPLGAASLRCYDVRARSALVP